MKMCITQCKNKKGKIDILNKEMICNNLLSIRKICTFKDKDNKWLEVGFQREKSTFPPSDKIGA